MLGTHHWLLSLAWRRSGQPCLSGWGKVRCSLGTYPQPFLALASCRNDTLQLLRSRHRKDMTQGFRCSSRPGLGSGSQESTGTERADVCQCGSGLGPSARLILRTLEHYLEMQGKQNVCALGGILARLQLDQFEPVFFQSPISTLILLKALPKLPPHRPPPVHVRTGLSRLIKKMVHLIEMETCLWLTVWPILEKNMVSLKLHPEVSLPCCGGQEESSAS